MLSYFCRYSRHEGRWLDGARDRDHEHHHGESSMVFDLVHLCSK